MNCKLQYFWTGDNHSKIRPDQNDPFPKGPTELNDNNLK